MMRLGAGLIVLGACIFILPMIGLQLRGVDQLGGAQIPIANGSIIIGIILVIVGGLRGEE